MSIVDLIPAPYRLAAIGGACALCALSGSAATWRVMSWKDGAAAGQVAKAEVKLVEHVVYREREGAALAQAAGEKAAAVQTRIQVVYRDRIQEVPAHVTAAADARCIVPLGFVRVVDAAALDAALAPIPTGQSDDTPSGVDCSAVAASVVGNYGLYHGVAAQLIGLQDFELAAQALDAQPLDQSREPAP